MTESTRQRTRLAYEGPLDPVIVTLCAAYELGEPSSFSIIVLGYEDCNVLIETELGRFVAKMFSKARKQEDRDRYVTTMQTVIAAGVNHPRLHTTQDGNVVFTTSGIGMVVMDYIDGQSFWSPDRVPNDAELHDIIKQAAIISAIQYKPDYCFDSWAIPHIRQLFDRVKEFLSDDDRALAEKAVKAYEELPLDELPLAFVHGDFTKANVMTDESSRAYILDFAVSNTYPRIQELAVIAANLLHSTASPTSLSGRCEKVAAEYQGFTPLTDIELHSLYAYSLAGVASEFLGAQQELHINSNATKENEWWMRLGRDGLRQEFGVRS